MRRCPLLKAYVTGGIIMVYAVVLLLIGQTVLASIAAACSIVILGNALRSIL